MSAAPHPPAWRPNRRGDGLRRRYGALALSLYRRAGRSGWWLSVSVRLDVHDAAEAAALGEAVAESWLQAHRVTREGVA